MGRKESNQASICSEIHLSYVPSTEAGKCFKPGARASSRIAQHYCSALLLSYRSIVTLNVLWLFLAAQWVGLQCVIVVFPDHTHLLSGCWRGTIVDFCFKNLSLLMYDYIAHVMSLLSVHITDVYRLY